LPQDTAANLIFFNRFEQCLEVAFAEALITLALDDLEEDRANLIRGEDLEQRALTFGRCAIDQDLTLGEFGYIFAVAGQASVDLFVVGIGYPLKLNAVTTQRIYGVEDIIRA
jgi:hypothetical protein